MQDILLKQSDLEIVLKAVFPENRIISNSRKQSHDVINLQQSNPHRCPHHHHVHHYPFELDVWLPEVKLAFEFQDPYHYVASGIFQDLPTLQQRDHAKKAVAEKKGITLIIVPCWWDGKTESLVSTVKFFRKDLLLDHKDEHSPIPNVPPPGYFDEFKGLAVPGIGDLMSSSTVPPSNIAPRTWWISEKYDGYRAFWNYEHDCLYTRWGRKLDVRDRLSTLFPKIHLDGEIWAGRGEFEKAMRTMKHNHELNTWDTTVRFVVFDSLRASGDTTTYEDRLDRLLCSDVVAENPFIVPTTCALCDSKQHMREFMKYVLSAEGEGIVLRKVKSVYEKGRSSTLVKLKAIRDQEALCVDVLPDSYLLKLPNDVTFVATLRSVEIKAPKPGDVVTFMFKYYSASGQPNNAEIMRVREDILWRDVLDNSSHSPAINKINEVAVSERKQYQHWGLADASKALEYLNTFAMDTMGRDPLLPSSWYDITTNHIKSQPWGTQIMRHYGWNMQSLLLSVYPNIGFEAARFGKISKKFWDAPENIRKYLDQVAAKRGFNPLIASNWYNHASSEMFNNVEKGYLLQKYGGYKKVLATIYGKYGVKASEFDTVPMNYYESIENRRNFFTKVAATQGLDPSNMDDWYSLSGIVVHQHGGQHVLKRYKRSIYAAVQDIFPNHTWDESKFKVKPSGYWNPTTIRQYFDEFAKKHNFDPLIAENWYTITRASFTRQKEGKRILKMFYGGSLFKAVKNVYPHVSFNLGLFTRVSANYWKSKANARMFFDTLAKKRGFDPLQPRNWYNLPRHVVQAEKGGKSVLALYGESMVTALATLYHPEVTFNYHNFPKTFRYKKHL